MAHEAFDFSPFLSQVWAKLGRELGPQIELIRQLGTGGQGASMDRSVVSSPPAAPLLLRTRFHASHRTSLL